MRPPGERDGLDLSRLSPGDAVVALRSFPRRYGRLLSTFGDDEAPEDLLHRPGPGGLSALDQAQRAARSFAALHDALHRVLIEDGPAVGIDAASGPVALPGQRDPSVEAVLDGLGRGARALAEEAAGAEPDAWRRTATVDPGVVGTGEGRTLSALDLVREAVRAGAEGLRAVESALVAARRS